MEGLYKETLWKNFAAAIDILKGAVKLCPDELWQEDRKFFYLTYHTTIFLAYYLTRPVRDFTASLPYTITDPGKSLPSLLHNDRL